MAHSEKCPVCNGTGKLETGKLETPDDLIPCHGCGGKGWIEVSDVPCLPPSIPKAEAKHEESSKED